MSALSETIAGLPGVVARALELDLGDAHVALGKAARVWLVGTGTSQHAAELGARMLLTAGVDARAVSGASFDRSVAPVASDDAVLVVTHTGETAFARAAYVAAEAAGLPVLSITGEGKGWEGSLEVAPPERSETYTASYLAVLTIFARLAVALGGTAFGIEELEALPSLVEDALGLPLPLTSPPARLLVLFGSGPASITAREGALKLREAAHLPAEGFESEYLLHGSAVPLGDDDVLVAIDPAGDASGLSAAICRTAAAEGIAVHEVAPAPGLHPLPAQIPLTVVLQRQAAYLAENQGLDPDSVIVAGWADDSLWNAGAPDQEVSG